MRLAVPLLLLVAVTHFGYELLALGYDQREAAAKAWFYMLRGVEGVALFGIVAALSRHRAVIFVCVLGMLEEGMTTACRASKPIGGVLGYEPFSGLCGPGWYQFGLGLVALVALAIAYETGRKTSGKTRT